MNTLRTSLLALAAVLGVCYPTRGDADVLPCARAAQGVISTGPQHALLQKLAGTWEAVIIAPDQTGAECRTQGTLVRTRLAGFHTIDSFAGTFMGMPMVGHGLNGYCTVRQQYFTFWTDSLTASPLTLFGDYDAKKGELAMVGECVGSSGRLEKCRTVTRFVDDDHIAWALFGSGQDGKEVQHLRIEYTRKP